MTKRLSRSGGDVYSVALDFRVKTSDLRGGEKHGIPVLVPALAPADTVLKFQTATLSFNKKRR